MNENLRRALLRARLTDEDVAAQLEVDPKTVRRWLEGRIPYLRHRWALAGLLGLDETDLWPEIRAALAARSRPEEIQAVYPSWRAVPPEVWLCLLTSAEHEIGILDDSGLLLADQAVLSALADKARAGVKVRVCLLDPDHSDDSRTTQRSRRGLRRRRLKSAMHSAGPGRYAPPECRSGCTRPPCTSRFTVATASSSSLSMPTASPPRARPSSVCAPRTKAAK